jgi:hypothetical protein
MAYFYKTFACDSGGEAEEHAFEVFLENDELPSFCPKCGCPVDPESEAVPGTHSIGGSDIAKGVDLTYSLLEASGEYRAEQTGNPNFKITNMKDHLREGDVAAVLPNNTVTGFMADAENRGVRYGWGAGAVGAPSFNSAPSPVRVDPTTGFTGAGHKALSSIQGTAGQVHLGNRAQQIVAGQVNKTKAG